MPDAEIEKPLKQHSPLDTYRILTLENAENIEKLKLACLQAGHEVVPMLTISHAMAFLETKDHVDCIVAAAHLHNESVFEFLQKVRGAESHLKDSPFVVLCADPGLLAKVTSPAVEAAANLMGADKYVLMNEFDAHRLIDEITPLLPPIPLRHAIP